MRPQIRALVEGGRLREALKAISSAASLSIEEQLVQCELEAAAGHRSLAHEIALRLLSKECAASQRIRALLVAGRIEFYLGQTGAAHGRFQLARTHAAASGDTHLLSLVLGAHVDCLFHFESFESGLAHLSDFKRAAIRSGRSEDLFTLRILLAEAELKGGRSHRAAQELELAGIHQTALPNAVREAQLAFVGGVVALSLGQLRLARDRTKRAVELAEGAGATTIEEPSRNNLAHLHVVQGDYKAAQALVAQLVNPRPQSLDVELLRRATHLQLVLESGDLDIAAAIETDYADLARNRSRRMPIVQPRTLKLDASNGSGHGGGSPF